MVSTVDPVENSFTGDATTVASAQPAATVASGRSAALAHALSLAKPMESAALLDELFRAAALDKTNDVDVCFLQDGNVGYIRLAPTANPAPLVAEVTRRGFKVVAKRNVIQFWPRNLTLDVYFVTAESPELSVLGEVRALTGRSALDCVLMAAGFPDGYTVSTERMEEDDRVEKETGVRPRPRDFVRSLLGAEKRVAVGMPEIPRISIVRIPG